MPTKQRPLGELGMYDDSIDDSKSMSTDDSKSISPTQPVQGTSPHPMPRGKRKLGQAETCAKRGRPDSLIF